MKPEQVCSDEYKAVLQTTHRNTKGWGNGGRGWAPTAFEFARELGAVHTILDYGCGQGLLKRALESDPLFAGKHTYSISEYDPGIPGKDTLPGLADMVVCTDVLEHIEPALVSNVLEHIRSVAKRGAFFNIALKPAKQILSDGRNAHLMLAPPAWWIGHLQSVGFSVLRHTQPKGLNVWCR